jgi:hypothetical protein
MPGSERDGCVDATDGASTSLDPLEIGGRHGVQPPATLSEPLRKRIAAAIEKAAEDDRRQVPATVPFSTAFRHSGWKDQRKRTYAALVDAGANAPRLNRFAFCGSECYVMRSVIDPTKHRLAARCCHDRFCVPCGNERSRRIALNLIDVLKAEKARFVTLTIRHSTEPLDALLERLYAAFKLLLRHKLWKASQTGGVAFLEIKWNQSRETWHPHLHVLTQGRFIAQDKLARVWKAITKDSHIVDVRAVGSTEKATQYVTKYASKPWDPCVFRMHERLVELIAATHRRRMIIAFGTFRGTVLSTTADAGAWELVGDFEEIARRARAGEATARNILDSIGLTVAWRVNVILGPPDEPDPDPPPAAIAPRQGSFVFSR